MGPGPDRGSPAPRVLASDEASYSTASASGRRRSHGDVLAARPCLCGRLRLASCTASSGAVASRADGAASEHSMKLDVGSWRAWTIWRSRTRSSLWKTVGLLANGDREDVVIALLDRGLAHHGANTVARRLDDSRRRALGEKQGVSPDSHSKTRPPGPARDSRT